MDRLNDALRAMGIPTMYGYFVFPIPALLSEMKMREHLTLTRKASDNLREIAGHYLRHASLGQGEREWLEEIEGGWLPEGFSVEKDENVEDNNG